MILWPQTCCLQALALSILASACEPPPTPPVPAGLAAPPCEPEVSRYLITTVVVPRTVGLAAEPRIDLDMNGRFTDNDLGDGVAWLVERGARIQQEVDSVLSSSDHAFMIRVEQCGEEYVRLTSLVVRDDDGDPDNSLLDSDRFQIVAEPEYGAVGTEHEGAIRAFDGTGFLPFRVLFDVDDQEPLDWIPVAGVQLDVERTPTSMSGILAGGYITNDLPGELTPPVTRSLNDALLQDPGCPSMCENMLLRGVLDLYDENRDGVISAEESAVFFAFRHENLNLFADYEGSTVYWPNHDGVRDSRGLFVQFVAERTEAIVQ